MRCFQVFGLLGAVIGFAQSATAADYASVPYAPPVGPAPIVELGTGWYLRGDLGVGEGTQAQFQGNLKVPETRTTWSGSLGFGYKLNAYLRTDLTVNYFKPQHFDMSGGAPIVCPYALEGLTDQVSSVVGQPPLKRGYLFGPEIGTCNGHGSADLKQINALANAYIDLGTYFGITPYIGGGAGVARVVSMGSSDYYKTSDGTAYRADLSPVAGYPLFWTNASGVKLSPQPTSPTGQRWSFAPQNFARSFNKTKYGLAWALMGGFSYNVTDQAAIDVGYQYVDNGTYTSTPDARGKTVKRDLSVQQAKVGFRYQID